MQALEAIDEELEGLAEERDLSELVARAHASLPDRSEGMETIDALLENLGAEVSVPVIEPVGVEVPPLRIPPPTEIPATRPALEVPDTAVRSSAPPAAFDDEDEAPKTDDVPMSVLEAARAADAAVDDAVSDGLASESGLDADALFGDLDADGALDPFTDGDTEAPELGVASSAPPPSVAPSAPPPSAPPSAPPSMPPPPPIEALGDIEELDIDEIEIDDDFELMIEDADADTFVGDAAEVEAALDAAESESTESEPTDDGEGSDDDEREQSFFKKLFG